MKIYIHNKLVIGEITGVSQHGYDYTDVELTFHYEDVPYSDLVKLMLNKTFIQIKLNKDIIDVPIIGINYEAPDNPFIEVIVRKSDFIN